MSDAAATVPAGEPPEKPSDEFNATAQLANAVEMRSNEDQTLWASLGTFWAANAVLLVAIFATGDIPTNGFVGVVISVVGLAISWVWSGIQSRSLGHIAYHEDVIEALEWRLKTPPDLALSGKINTRLYEKHLGSKQPKARDQIRRLLGFSIVAWLISLILFVGYFLAQIMGLAPEKPGRGGNQAVSASAANETHSEPSQVSTASH